MKVARGKVAHSGPLVASPNGALVEGHEATPLARFLNDESAVHRYPDLKPEHFGSPVNREIFEAELRLHYDGDDTNFLALEDYFRRRGKLSRLASTRSQHSPQTSALPPSTMRVATMHATW
jgi:replicative DNA helicase